MSKNEKLDATLALLPAITEAVDFRWLREFIWSRLNDHHRSKLHGYAGGHEGYSLSEALDAVAQSSLGLDADDLNTLSRVVNILYPLLAPLVGSQSRGTVQLKTIIKEYPEIDWQATKEAGFTIYVFDQKTGAPLLVPFSYTYVYIRIHASKGDADKRRSKLLSIYADRGMGKGGTGGIVACCLLKGIITSDEILDAWHAGLETYGDFVTGLGKSSIYLT